MRIFSTLLILALFASCNNKQAPPEILPKEKMEKVLWELLQADEWAFYIHQLDTTARKQAALQHYAEVYRINGIDAKVFKQSYEYYSKRPALLSPVLDSVRNMATPPTEPMADPKPRKVLRPL
jgi:hypothetical protein